ncbi:uncharacterized protein RHOBADRAFT_53018 [Rhodotorula graminis WP1]|uniref:RRM domain-containing protein n=1 Tax=Rhodotorula graminis (strain WP1) TaxID=578459 RepID=A0A194S605_RHOGW|nr:uncharacterized protein RHOBADRAFT_53018 [Rhodotorula graminis WP1]KPV76017.1 hypothetical protein RHOBADRAFT_53018 [Rhodotorula graminis WP1]
MAAVPVLADPSAMTPGERTNELVALVQRDDLLGVLLVLLYCGEAEVNSTATLYRTSPVEAALLYPTRRTPVRRLIAECLLHRGARTDHLAQNMPSRALPAIESILSSWDDGGRERATISYDLSFTMDLYAAEEYLQEHGYGPDGPPDPPSADSSSAPAVLAPVSHAAPTPPTPPHDDPHRPVDSPSNTLYELVPQDAATPSRRDGPSDHAPSPRDDSRRSENAQWPSRVGSDRHEPRRRSRSPDRRRDSYARDGRERRSRSPRPDQRRLLPRHQRSPSPRRQQRDISPVRLPQALSSASATAGGSARWIFETLLGLGVRPFDMFMSKSRNKPLRFAFVGFDSASAATKAMRELHGLRVDGVKLSASRFCDKHTGSTQPRIPASDLLDRRYIGPQAQSELASFERQPGLFFLHLAPSTTEVGIRKLLCRYLSASKVGFIEVRHAGLTRTAFADLADDESCRKAIIECDGAVVDGYAVRVSWLERRNSWRPPRNSAFVRSSPPRPIPIDDAALKSRASEAGTPSPRVPPAPTTPGSALQPSPPQNGAYGPEVEHLRTIGLSDEQIVAVQQLWRPIERDEVGGPTLERRMDVKVDFGCVVEEDARLALAQNAREPAFPDDSASQARYSAFLEAQVGKSRDYYTVFFAKLAEFSSSSVAFAAKARSVAEEARRDMSATMDVGDGRGVKEEERA